MDVSIIGGGMAGLYMAYRLLQRDPHIKVAVFEKSRSFGGKVRTQYDDHGNVTMEGGPWRVLEEHRRLRRLCRDMGCRLVKIQKAETAYLGPPVTKQKTPPPLPALSSLDLAILQDGQTYAYERECATGYNMSMDKSSAFPISFPTHYYVLEKGFHHLITQLRSHLPGHILHPNVMVRDVQRGANGYVLQCIQRCRDSYITLEHTTRKLILACPPQSMTGWGISPHLEALTACVEARSLNHMYCSFVSEPVQVRDCYFKTDNVLNQIISSNYANEWCQVSYTSGRIADFWGRLYLLDPLRCRREVEKNLRQLFSMPKRPRIRDIRNFYWEQAVHQWRPGYGFDRDKMFYMALYPHPMALPDLHVVGEAFSKQQGWMEGVLETVDALLSDRAPSSPPLPKQWVLFDGRVIDVGKWKEHHPGSEQAIMNHLYEDVTLLWRQIHSSPHSKMILLYNQVAWKGSDRHRRLFSHWGKKK